MFHIFNISILQLNFVTVLHALKYNNSSNTMQHLTQYLKDIEDIFTSGTIGKVPLKKNIYIRNNTYSCFTSVQTINKYAFSRGTARLTRYLTEIEDIFITSGTIGMASTRILCFSASLTTRLFSPFAIT
jgi:hypothetical protein